MTNLDCTVTNCKYNDRECCTKDTIQVDGGHAKTTAQTCCSSFEERRGNATKNSCCGDARKETNIGCKAVECSYNEACQCHAGHVGIAGQNACDCNGTECTTFCCNC